MQDQDVPPVEEGETGGGAAVVPRAAIRKADPVAINSATAFTRLQWITAIARLLPAVTTMAPVPAAIGLALRPIIRRRSLNHCRCAKMQPRASLVLSMTSFFRRRFRRPHAS